MINVHVQYIIDPSGEKVAVVIPINEYKGLIEEFERLKEVRMHEEEGDSVKKSLLPSDDFFRLVQ